jgi:hypothetical protein
VTNWGVYYVRLLSEGNELPVKKGDSIKMKFKSDCTDGNGKYEISVSKVGRNEVDLKFAWSG